MIRARPTIPIAVLGVAALLFATPMRAGGKVIRIDETGWPTLIESLPKERPAEEAFWTWTDHCFPQRVTAAQPETECLATGEAVVQVRTGERVPLNGLEIRWGTEEMLGELPDVLLPVAVTDSTGRSTIRAPKGTPLFARVAGPGLASRWTELSGSTTSLTAVRASPLHIVIRDAEGSGARQARLEIRTADLPSPHNLEFRGIGDGAIDMALPAGAYVRLLAWSDSGAPAIAVANTDRLPPALDLRTGVTLQGRIVDAKKSPIADVKLTAAFRVPPEDSIEKHVRSDSHGRFRFQGLDAREVEWIAEKPGIGTISRIARLKNDLDLGTVILSPARDVRLMVWNGRKQPIRAASIRTADGAEATTNAEGIATLRRVPADAFNARVVAFGYLPRELRIGEDGSGPPAPVILRDSARVRARAVRASDGLPAGPGTIAIELDGRKTMAGFDDSGKIEVAGLESGRLSLEIRAPGLAPFRLPDRTIAEGEVVDLGVLSLPAGLGITGRAVDGDSAAPLAGAAIHVLRPSTFGPLLSYARHDWITAESAADGTFRVTGLAPAVYSLWIEAPGHAAAIRTGIEARGDDDNADVALGDLAVPTGRTLAVSCEPVAQCGTTASVLLGGADWLPLSALSAPMVHGSASIAPVPAGLVTLRLADERGILHEREVTISADGPATNVHVRLALVTVSGTVMRMGKPAGGGTLLFRPGGAAQRVVQLEHPVSAGNLGSDFLGTVMRASTAEVTADGRFSVVDATPGDYWVTRTEAAGQSPPIRITIPETATDTLRIDLPGGRIEGIVLTADGTPTPVLVTTEAGDNGVDARGVGGQTLGVGGQTFGVGGQTFGLGAQTFGVGGSGPGGSRGQAFAAADGTFSIFGLPPGTVTVRAQTRTLTAEQVIQVSEGQTGHVELILRPREEHSLLVTVRADGVPLPNAVVFLRENGVMSAATSAGDGTATMRLARSDATIEAAVYSPLAGWTFVSPQRGTDLTALTVDFEQPAGTLVITAPDVRRQVSVYAPTGFPIHDALPLLGIAPVTPLRFDRLPRGSYRVVSRGVAKTVEVLSGLTTVEY